MNPRPKKQMRLSRLHAVRRRELDSLGAQLAALNQVLQKVNTKIQRMQDETVSLSDRPTLSHLQYSVSWRNNLDITIDCLKEERNDLLVQRESLLKDVTKKKSRLQGLDKLVQKLNAELRSDQQRAALNDADDRFLQDMRSN